MLVDDAASLSEPAYLEVGQAEPCRAEKDYVGFADLPRDGQALLRDADDVIPGALIEIGLGLHRPPGQQRSGT